MNENEWKPKVAIYKKNPEKQGCPKWGTLAHNKALLGLPDDFSGKNKHV